jgi:hypothetical protein
MVFGLYSRIPINLWVFNGFWRFLDFCSDNVPKVTFFNDLEKENEKLMNTENSLLPRTK